jgi:pentatricopeptide repeat protein
VVDLDKNLVTLGPDTAPLPPLPPQLKAHLVGRLEENVGMVFREARSLRKNDDYSGSGEKLQPHVKLMADAMWEGRLCLFDEAFHLFFTPEESRKNLLNGNDTSGMDTSERDGVPVHIITNAEKQNMRKQSTWDAVQEAFLDSYVYLLRNYRKFLVFPSKDNEGSYGGAGFRSKEFVQSQRYDMQPFLEELIGTQVYDNFITKRLYGSGEADVTFFDMAVDRFLKSQGLLSSGGRMLQGWRGTGGPSASQKPGAPGEGPLLQSARVHRKLKTIVPPEPSAEGLPPHPLAEQNQQHDGGPVITKTALEDASEMTDDMSVNSLSSYGTQSTSRSNRTSPKKSIQDKAAEILDKHSKYRYTYETFPSEFNSELFGEPRPLSQAVIAEFDRQKKAAARFRRKKSAKHPEKAKLTRAQTENAEIPPSAEVATFTLFFMAFSAVVGKELLEISDNPLLAQEKTILATYNHPEESDLESEVSEGDSIPTTIATSTGGNDDDFEDALDNNSVTSGEANRGNKVAESDDDEFVDSKEEPEPAKEKKVKIRKEVRDPNKPRSRFQDSLSALQIEEAKATGRAQLALAFEMLTMMKKRGLKADPEAYQCLIDACGRVGDTKRATDLLGKMHEDGIVADGVVYSCLVSAFSAESAWKKSSGEAEEDLPEWANSTAVEMDWNKLNQKTTFMASAKQQLATLAGKTGEEDDDDADSVGSGSTPFYYNKLRKLVARKKEVRRSLNAAPSIKTLDNMSFFITEAVEMQIELGENLLEIVYPDISVDTDNETCPRCNFLLSDDDVVAGWTPNDSQDYATSCPNCTQRFVPHFHVQSTSPTFMGSRGPASPLFCERLSPWVLQKEIRTVMSDREGIENLLSPEWVEAENKNAVLWWNLVLSCMRYRFPFTFLLQGSFDLNLIAPMPVHDD